MNFKTRKFVLIQLFIYALNFFIVKESLPIIIQGEILLGVYFRITSSFPLK